MGRCAGQGKDHDPYGRVSLQQSCPRKLKRVLSLPIAPGLGPGGSAAPLATQMWEAFVTDLSDVTQYFVKDQGDSGDVFVNLICCCFPCFLAWRSKFLVRNRQRMLEALLRRHRDRFESLGFLLRLNDLVAHLGAGCLCLAAEESIPVIEIIWDPSLWTDRI